MLSLQVKVLFLKKCNERANLNRTKKKDLCKPYPRVSFETRFINQSVRNIKRSDYLSVKLRLASHLKSTDLEFVYCYRLISEVDENLTQVN